MDINCPININQVGKFNQTKDYYEQKVYEYSVEMRRNKIEVERVNTYLKDQVKKINLLKSTAIKTSVNKYIFNVRYLGIKWDEEVLIKEETFKKVNSFGMKHKNFDELITFNRKNIIQKAASIAFRTKIINDRISVWEEKNRDILIKNQVLILKQYNLLEELYNKRLRLIKALEQVDKLEKEFSINKEKIRKALKNNSNLEEVPVLMILKNYKELVSKIVHEEY